MDCFNWLIIPVLIIDQLMTMKIFQLFLPNSTDKSHPVFFSYSEKIFLYERVFLSILRRKEKIDSSKSLDRLHREKINSFHARNTQTHTAWTWSVTCFFCTLDHNIHFRNFAMICCLIFDNTFCLHVYCGLFYTYF